MLVTRRDDNGVTTLTLNRPDKLNALSIPLLVDLRTRIDEVATDDRVGCVVLTGEGRSFCAGHDLESIASGERAPSRHFESETVEALERLPQPTIAKIRGHCLTGGLELALGCDVLVAGESASLADTHGKWGLVPVWGMSVRLPERVGLSMAKELSFTSRRIPGVRAAEIGLVDHVYADDDLDDEVETLAREIVENSWGTNRIVKELYRVQADCARTQALAYERQAPFGMPPDMKERMSGRPSRKGG